MSKVRILPLPPLSPPALILVSLHQMNSSSVCELRTGTGKIICRQLKFYATLQHRGLSTWIYRRLADWVVHPLLWGSRQAPPAHLPPMTRRNWLGRGEMALHFGRGEMWRVGGTMDMARWPRQAAFLTDIRLCPRDGRIGGGVQHIRSSPWTTLGSSWCPAAGAAPILTTATDRKEEEAGGGG